MRAFYRLQHNDVDLTEIRVGWSLPNMFALESVVKSIATNTLVFRLDIRHGDENLIPDTPAMLENTWWYGKEQDIADIIASGLKSNQSITKIHIKDVRGMDIMQFVQIASSCQQLEKVIFHCLHINEAEMNFILTNLHVKEVRFKRCCITFDVALVALSTLKRYQHPFLLVHLFDSKSGEDAINLREHEEYKRRILRKIFLCCYHNNFQVDRNEFITEFAEKGMSFKRRLALYCAKGDEDFNMLRRVHCRSRDQNLWYAGIMAAIRYDKEHDFLWKGDGGQPNMLYSLIREHLDNLLKFI